MNLYYYLYYKIYVPQKLYYVLALLGRHSKKEKRKLCWEEKRGIWAAKLINQNWATKIIGQQK